ncbi:MAG: hypothetical protein HYU88_12075 [Chloroflexi bacterium]|nr:hypothetical protein [Chloroflexota bacterium]
MCVDGEGDEDLARHNGLAVELARRRIGAHLRRDGGGAAEDTPALAPPAVAQADGALRVVAPLDGQPAPGDLVVDGNAPQPA